MLKKYYKLIKIKKWVEIHEKNKTSETYKTFIGKIEKKCDGNFMYLSSIFKEVESGILKNIQDFPKTISDYYKSMLMEIKNKNKDKLKWNSIRYVLLTLSNAKTTLSFDLLTELANMDKENILDAINEWEKFLKIQFINGKEHFSLSHQSISDFMALQRDFKAIETDYFDNKSDKLYSWLICNKNGEILFSEIFKDISQEAKKYFLLFIIPTLIDTIKKYKFYLVKNIVKSVEKQKRRIEKILEIDEYYSEKLKIYNSTELFLNSIEDEYNKLKSNNIDTNMMELKLSEFLLLKIKSKKIKIDDIFLPLAYRNNTKLFENITNKMLVITKNDLNFNVMLSLKLVSLYRRYGLLTKAINISENTNNILKNVDKFYKDKSTSEYERAFIFSFQNKTDKAVNSFVVSMEFADKSFNETSKIFTECAMIKWGYLFKTEGYQNIDFCINKLKQNQEKLQKAKKTKWVRNISLYIYELAYYKNDKELTQEYYDKYIGNDWSQKYTNDHAVKYLRARQFLIKQKYEKAIEIFAYLPQNKNELKIKEDELKNSREYARLFESIASKYYDYGYALYKNGDKDKAKAILNLGLDTRKDYGNKPFFEKINKLLNKI